jgi:hypothetical protein
MIGFADVVATAEYELVREDSCVGGGVPGESRPKSKRLREVSGERAEARPTYLWRAAEAFLDAEDRNEVETLDANLDEAFVGDRTTVGSSR